MPLLLLSPRTTALLVRLRALALPDSISVHLASPRRAPLTSSSPAVPAPSLPPPSSEAHGGEGRGGVDRWILPHSVLVDIVTWSQSPQARQVLQRVGSEWLKDDLTLWTLLQGSEVWVQDKREKFVRSPSLDASLRTIQHARDTALYLQLTSSLPLRSSPLPPNYRSIAGCDPTLPLLDRIVSTTVTSDHPSLLTTTANEQAAWRQTSSLLSVMANILLSVLAIVAAVWYACAATPLHIRVLLALAAAIVTAAAEVVLYARYGDYVEKSKRIKSQRLKGSDVPATCRDGDAATPDDSEAEKPQRAAESKAQPSSSDDQAQHKPFSFKT